MKPTYEELLMNYDEMEAGSYLDQLIAQRVMNWVCPENYNYWMTIYPGGTFDLHAHRASWHPSTDITAAQRVAEHLKDRYPNILTLSDPLAICRAALKAVSPTEGRPK